MAKPKIPPLQAELVYNADPGIVEIIHPDGFRQYVSGIGAVFYRMKVVADGADEAAKWFRTHFGDVERIAC